MMNNFISRAPNRVYQICSRCVMDTSDPWIIFDRSGFCNHCSDFLNRRLSVTFYGDRSKDDNSLPELFGHIRSLRKKGDSHDVVIGVSGGVDSSMTARLAQQAGLKVLAVHMDNGWNTPIAIRNVLKLIESTGIDYKAVVLDWNNFKSIQRAFIDAGVPDIELPTDIAIQSALHGIAARYGVRTILSGGNVANEGILPAAWLYNARDTHYALSIVRRAGLSTSSYGKINLGFAMEAYYRLFKGIRTFYPLNLIAYHKNAARDKLKVEMDWRDYGGKHCESVFTRFAQLIYLPMRHKVDYRRGYLSADICLGNIRRQDAIVELESFPWKGLNVKADIEFISRKLSYKSGEIDSIIRTPGLWYRDFPNRERLLGFAYSTYRFLSGKRKASNF
jgi:hypothetical protein